MRAWCLPLVSVFAFLLGCSADAVSPPEPTITTEGAFVAIPTGENAWHLYRTLMLFTSDETTVLLLMIVYEPTASSLDEARELAQDPDLPVKDPFEAIGVNPKQAHVVWFRTLEPEETEVLD